MGSNRKQTVGLQDDELDSAGCTGEPPAKGRSLKITVHAVVAEKAMSGDITWLEVERQEGRSQQVGRPAALGERLQDSEPS